MADKVMIISKALKNASAETVERLRSELLSTPVETVWDIAELERTNEKTVAILRANFQRYEIFCASAKKDNLLMWSHYSDHHRGIVLELSPSRPKDSVMLLSHPVTYSIERPLMYRTARQMIEQSLTMQAEDSARSISEGLIYTKGIDWAYEAEWRFYIPDFVPLGKTSGFLQLHPEEITAVYFGSRSQIDDQQQIIRLAKEINPAVKFYRMKMADREYALACEEIEHSS
jgi:hypothetical protein